MPDNKICTSIAVGSVDEVRHAIAESESDSEFIEIRLDALANAPTVSELSSVTSNSRIIFTLRPASQGGLRNISDEERRFFWRSVSENLSDFDDSTLFDIEHDIAPSNSLPRERVIASMHDFNSDIADKESVLRDLAKYADIVKLAWMSDEAEQSVEIFRLLKVAESIGTKLIPIAMGEAGKISRILAVAKGSPFSYCASDDVSKTAPGQIAASDMDRLFRIDSISESTTVFGLIAGDTSYSLSPRIHNSVFASNGTDSVFIPMQTKSLRGLIERLMSKEFPFDVGGFAVTNPFKIDAKEFADELDESALRTGAVNTLKVVGGRSKGFNTDVRGFIAPLKRRMSDLEGSKVAVIGSGGAARAAIVALIEEGCDVTVFGRDATRLEAFKDEFQITIEQLSERGFNDFRIVVNATPLGTAGPLVGLSAADASSLKGAELAYDLVYNPKATKFLIEAREAGCQTLGGLEMLVEQAMEQQRIWTGSHGDAEQILSLISR